MGNSVSAALPAVTSRLDLYLVQCKAARKWLAIALLMPDLEMEGRWLLLQRVLSPRRHLYPFFLLIPATYDLERPNSASHLGEATYILGSLPPQPKGHASSPSNFWGIHTGNQILHGDQTMWEESFYVVYHQKYSYLYRVIDSRLAAKTFQYKCRWKVDIANCK